MPAIVETVMSQLVAEGRELHAALIKSERDAAVQRVLMGRFLIKARKQMPRRARTADEGWTAFLEAIEMDGETARRYIALADATLNLNVRNSDDVEQIPSYEQLGLTKRESPQPPSDLPPPRDEDEPPEAAAERHGDAASSPAPTVEVDRNTWCTPKWLAEALGDWDLDPCSNERSHIQAARELRWERSEDGIFMASSFPATTRAFINPPYARGEVIRWVRAYAHVRFCFLLKFDPSTDWFEELMQHTGAVLIPKGTRINFEPPEGVAPEDARAVQFPHALFYADVRDATPAIKQLCFPPWRISR